MREVRLPTPSTTGLRLLCLGAHADDIEIGCGGLVLELIEQVPVDVHWIVFSATGTRAREARQSAKCFLRGARRSHVTVHKFRDGFFPYDGSDIKTTFERLKGSIESPDVVLTHYRDDRHQDHRMICELTWNTFRDHAVLEYEVPKYDGDLGSPNCFVPLGRDTCARKVKYLEAAFVSQRDRHWFSSETFLGLMRLRGVECRADSGYAEAFYARKLVLGVRGS